MATPPPTRSFGLTFDYLCPFARNANEHVIEALRAGADWEVRFTPYSQSQGNRAEGDPDVWALDEPNRKGGVLALQVGLAVRDLVPERFLDAHEALFAARHDDGRDIKDPNVLREALARVGVDVDQIFEAVAEGGPLDTLRKEHEAAVRDHEIWGVPTFIAGDRAMFARLLTRPEGDGALATRTVERVLDLVEGFPELHELKQSNLPF